MGERLAKPDWLRVRLGGGSDFARVTEILQKRNLTTVCTEAGCPNLGECWGQYRTATLMVLGEICTRGCRFCSVTKGPSPLPPASKEPEEVAQAVKDLELKHAVVTMVTRDDLEDGGAAHLAATVAAIRKVNPACTIEILSSDLMGRKESVAILAASNPEVISHNIETVRSLKKNICGNSDYDRSLKTLKLMKKLAPSSVVKSSLMLGLGETREEILETMDNLLGVGVSIINLGQYLQPTKTSLLVEKYWSPDEFAELKERALEKGFIFCESGPLVRSSFHAGKHYNEYKKIMGL